MKKIVLMMVALLSMTAVQAQESDNNKNQQQFRGPRQMTPEQMTERMTNDLKLNDEQKTKVLALNKEYEKVIAGPGMRGPRPQRPDGESGATAQNGQQRPERPQLTDEQREEMKQRMEKRQEYEKKLKEILTEDQYKKYQESRPGRRGFGRGHGRGGRPGGFGHGGPRPQD
jgi:Spy/CpxP family protein refolding chaperone